MRSLLAALLFVSACADGGPTLLVVDLRTDLAPVAEFAEVEVVLIQDGEAAGALITREVFADEDYIEGERLAEYEEITPGPYRIRVRLRDSLGALVTERITQFTIESGTLAITVLVTRDCRGVVCPGAGDDPSRTQCHAGGCVPPECSPENLTACGAVSCDADTACTFAAACAVGRCVSGVCLADPVAGACGEEEFCNPSVGCEPVGDTCVAGVACDPPDVCASGAIDCSTGEPVCRVVGPAAAGKPCRPAVDGCDAPEACDGTSMVCPADELAPVGTPCDDGFCNGLGTCGECTEGEACATGNDCELGMVECSTGTPVCMGAGPVMAGVSCRPSAGDCDVEESCDGIGTTCPVDVFRPSTELCRPAAGACDVAELCTGSDAACPADVVADGTTECRAAAGLCDLAESCDGASVACGVDVRLDPGSVCRATAAPCDGPEACDGSVACPADAPLLPGCSMEYRTAGESDFVVPIGCTDIEIGAWGAGGGQGLSNTRNAAGGFARGNFSVTPGSSLVVWVGAPGLNATNVGALGGIPGGGNGGDGLSSQGGGGGGGYSGVFTARPVAQSNALVIAGGGGGSGGGASSFAGAGGGTAGQAGSGGAGTQMTGGACGGGPGCTAGSALQGGTGGRQNSGDGGGGGGGGWFGGGGGTAANTDAGGGGGGAGHVAAEATAGFLEAGNRSVAGNAASGLRMMAGDRGQPGAVLLRCL